MVKFITFAKFQNFNIFVEFMNMYIFNGYLTKEKKYDNIYCIAPNIENAQLRCSKFSSDLVFVSEKKLGPSWDNYNCN